MADLNLALRGVVAQQLNTIPGGTFHRRAPDNAKYPYKVFSFGPTTPVEGGRWDYSMYIDIWDRGIDPKQAEHIQERIMRALDGANLPGDDILPTFYLDSAFPVDDPDKELIHYQMHFTVQAYKRRLTIKSQDPKDEILQIGRRP